MITTKAFRQIDTYFDDQLNNSDNEFLSQEFTTDDFGNVLSDIQYDDEGNVTSEHICVFNEDNDLIKELRKDNGFVLEDSEYQYVDGLLVKEIHNYDDGLKETLINTYDDNKHRISQESFDTDNELSEKLVYSYDINNLSKIEYEDIDGNRSLYQQFEYNPQGKISRSIYINLDGKTIETAFYYDEKNRLIKTISYNEFKDIDNIETNEYDDKDQIIKTVRRDNDRTISYLYDFNDDGHVYHYSIVDSEGNTIQETSRNFDGRFLINSITETYTIALNRKDIEKVRFIHSL